MAKIAINGFGRIGRTAFKIILNTPGLEVVAINDLVSAENLAYLLKYDSAYGTYEHAVKADGNKLIVDNQDYQLYSAKNPVDLPWHALDVDIVLECTGFFTRREDMEKHREAGAKYVLLSAPVKSAGEEVPTVVHGVNAPDYNKVKMISCASCTTNCITPLVEVMGRRIGIQKAIMTTIHAYTSSQSIVDGPSKSVRRGRAGAANFVPTSTGSAVATSKVLPEYKGLFDGVAIRGPVIVGSISDVIFLTERKTSVEEVNQIFREEAASERYAGILGATEEELVSADIIGDSHASLVDLKMTRVVDGDLVKVMSWYDNEWGFTSQMIREAARLAREMGLDT
jgi:glyceraldehyde 3-phosphate dehydrogenase